MSQHRTRPDRPVAEHYVRASRIMSPEELRVYDRNRRAQYPHTSRLKNPTKEMSDDEAQYKSAQEAAKDSMEEYDKKYTQHAGKDDIDTLSEAKHSTLLTPASDAAVKTGWHAHARDLFLVKHPYGYTDRYQRRQHEQNLDRAIGEADRFADIYATHARGAAGDLHSGLAGKAVAGYRLNPAGSTDGYGIHDDDEDDENYGDGHKGGEDSSDDGRELLEYYQAKFSASSRQSHASSSGKNGRE